MDDFSQSDICRVCRCEATSDRQLFHPCICTGSIKWIHQDCLMQWMRYSRKEYCELCGHRFSFTPIYSPDMPRVLPIRVVASGLLSSIMKAVKYWLHYTLVVVAWLGIVPLAAYRTYRFMFSGSFDSLMTLPYDMFSTENITADVFRGSFVMSCTVFSFIGLMWLRDQILHGGGPDWLEREDHPGQPLNAENGGNAPAQAENAAAAAAAPNDPNDGEAVENNNNLNNNNNILNNEQAVPAAPAAEVVVDHQQLADEADGIPVVNNIIPVANNEPEIPLLDVPIDPAEPPPLNPADEPEPAAQQPEAGPDEANWNPMEWDRAAEELTWERLLGLDGSMVFLEHVFWVISLNTIFIFIFAFCPFSIGNLAISFFGLMRPGKPVLHFHGLLTTLVGYCIIGITLVELHAIARFLRLRKPRRILGLCYIVVKVSLLSVVEIGVLPLVCGWWLDICSLPVFDVTLKERKMSFKAAPGTSLFLHWMFGMIYVYYFASFIVLLREVLRPGVLWFLRNLNDPDFSPIQEMIHLSIMRHTRRLIASTMIFGTAVLLMLWLPIQILKTSWPSFLPYALYGDSEVNELSIQLLLLQVVLPGVFEQSHTRIWLKGIVRMWFTAVAWVLGIRSYLLPAVTPDDDTPARPEPEPAQGLGAVHQALMQRDVPVGFQPFERPTWFALRLVGLLILLGISLVLGSLITLTIPVWVGRYGMSIWNVGNHLHHLSLTHFPIVESSSISKLDGIQEATNTARTRPPELYTAALGIYMCWILSRGVIIAVNLIPQGRAAVMLKVRHWVSVAASYAMAATIFVLMLGVVPLLFGLLLELVVVIPLRVSIEQTPIFFLWQDWALGVLYTKIACALTLMGPDWALRRAIERAYRDGIRDIDLKFIIRDLAAPVIMSFGLALAVPYVVAHSLAPLIFSDPMYRLLTVRLIYPFCLAVALVVGVIVIEIRQFRKLYVTIKNDKYLVGQRLVNYDHRKKKQQQTAAAAATAAAAN